MTLTLKECLRSREEQDDDTYKDTDTYSKYSWVSEETGVQKN